MSWIVVQTKSNKENKARINLIRQGYEVFYPKIKKSKYTFNEVKEYKAAFPGYICKSKNKSKIGQKSTLLSE